MSPEALPISDPGFSASSRILGIGAALAIAALQIGYSVALVVGLTSLSSPDQPIVGPVFVIMEILILLMLPAMVVLMVVVHEWAPRRRKALTLTALAFMVLVAGVSGSLHFVILSLGRHPDVVSTTGLGQMLAFEWPSVAYALDILAWDVFFAFSMLFAAPAFSGSGLAVSIRTAMILSGSLALAGLAGAITGDMQLRNVGIIGYLGIFLFVCALLAVLFYRTPPQSGDSRDRKA